MWLSFQFLLFKYSSHSHWIQQLKRRETNSFLGDSNVKQYFALFSWVIQWLVKYKELQTIFEVERLGPLMEEDLKFY